ncbi:acyltransferase family protein [Asticcacaulis sp. YBE204]|uniref:acyltransferase family protein n=1 Tax=Asticcacaulis sp. YBE204 TaxID=1282363 RepID=UPI0003C3C96E|nr:acyltransferase family protein [Asticcacaulis sp. YBE204]ESQ80537.1 hypothetical protein AEYBE204_04520 [Asticcacaulis sp. YBE204]
MSAEFINGARFHALDAVRGGALFLGVAFHTTLAYLEPHIWIVNDTAVEPGLGVVFFTIHMFRMSLFFLLAGFFARLLYQRYGAKAFAMNRLKRIAMPLAVFWTPVLAIIITMLIMAALKANPELASKPAAPPPPLTAETFPLTHLWFLYVLLILYALFVPLRGLFAFIDRGGSLRRAVDAVFSVIIKSGLSPLVFGLPLFLMLMAQPQTWMYWFGVPTPDKGVVPNAVALVAFGSAFGVGWLLHRNVGLLETIKKQWLTGIVSAIGFTAWCLWSEGIVPKFDMASYPAQMLYAASYVLGIWAWCLGLTGLALRFLDRPNPFWRYVADSSYWVYIVHLPLLLVLQYLALDLDWPAEAKFSLVVMGTLFISLATYQLLVRYSFIGTILNGKRVKPAKAKLKAQTL